MVTPKADEAPSPLTKSRLPLWKRWSFPANIEGKAILVTVVWASPGKWRGSHEARELRWWIVRPGPFVIAIKIEW